MDASMSLISLSFCCATCTATKGMIMALLEHHILFLIDSPSGSLEGIRLNLSTWAKEVVPFSGNQVTIIRTPLLKGYLYRLNKV